MMSINDNNHDSKFEELLSEVDTTWSFSDNFNEKLMAKVYQYEEEKYRKRTMVYMGVSVLLALALMIWLPLQFANYKSMIFIGYLLKLMALAIAIVILVKFNDFLSKKNIFTASESLENSVDV